MSNYYHEAKKRVEEKRKFYRHLSTYWTFGVFFFVMNAITDFGDWWFYWPMLGWGIGLASHYFKVFGLPGTDGYSAQWEEQEIQREIHRLETAQAARNRRAQSHQTAKPAREAEYEELELKELQKERLPKHQELSEKKWNDSDLV